MPFFSDFQLDDRILKALQSLGYETPTPIQELAIPKGLAGSDLIASAQTGTGKTAAFMLPVLHQLASQPRQKGRGPQVLVLVPTRELAMQVAQETAKYTKFLPEIKTVCVYGGVPYPPQVKALQQPYEILIATPGRLIDHMEQGRIPLSRVKFLVLDEADRMLDMGFLEPVEQIAAETSPEKQTFLFSATIDQKIVRISKKMQNNPFEIRITPDLSVKSNIEQRVYYADDFGHKLRLLDHLLDSMTINQGIIFTATKRQADELSVQLRDKGHKTAALHGDKDQRQRTRTIERMRRGQVNLLVATDVAARGIDIAAVSHVINMNLPYEPDDYVHRIGRTGRAGASGVAITFASFQEERLLAKMAEATSAPITAHSVEGMEPKPRQSRRSVGKAVGGKPRFSQQKPGGAPKKGGFKPYKHQRRGFKAQKRRGF